MKFITRSLLILIALYAVVFALGDAYLAHLHAPVWFALALSIAVMGLQYVVSPWFIECILTIVWDDDRTALPAVNRQFVDRLCSERGFLAPRIGIIHSGTPNAFAFGRVRRDARVVITTGLLDVLSPEEVNAVLAHEIGHIEHYDFIVMTLAALAPLLLYQIYVFTDKVNQTRAIAWGAFFFYWASEHLVLFLNRTREYFADHYAAEVTHAPETLSSALVKIAYGMVRADGEYKESLEAGSKRDKKFYAREHRIGGAIALMGISNVRSGAALVLGGANPEDAAAVMRWDLVNPWARLYELTSTHPLTALRVRLLNREAQQRRLPVEYPLPLDQNVQWGSFPLQVVLWAAPWICAAAFAAVEFGSRQLAQVGIHLPANPEPILLVALGLTWLIRISFRYRGGFEDARIHTLLSDLGVSQMRPRAVRLQGEIVGRGVPGAFWSPDLIVRDATGMLFVQYRQSIPFWRLLFAISKADEFIGKRVLIEGWFRRGLTPYVEMANLSDGDVTYRAYSRWIQYALASAVVLIGLAWRSTV